MTVDPTTAVWLALVEHQRRTVRPSRRARMWERIARRRAEIIAHLTNVNDGYVRRIAELEDEVGRLRAEVSADSDELDFFDSALHMLLKCCKPGDECDGQAVDQVFADLRARLAEAQPATSDDSGREYPQAWQASKPEGTIYREVEGVAQYWPPSVWLNADTERRWTPCGPNFRTLAAIRTFYRRQFRDLVKVPSPDCKNCDGLGCVACATDDRHPGKCEETPCPVCCGGS